MRKKFFTAIGLLSLSLTLSACFTLSSAGERVGFKYVPKNAVDQQKAIKELEKEGCKFVEDVNVAGKAGLGHDEYAYQVLLRNKAAELGGNYVLSSYDVTVGIPPKVKGRIYKCPESMGVQDF